MFGQRLMSHRPRDGSTVSHTKDMSVSHDAEQILQRLLIALLKMCFKGQVFTASFGVLSVLILYSLPCVYLDSAQELLISWVIIEERRSETIILVPWWIFLGGVWCYSRWGKVVRDIEMVYCCLTTSWSVDMIYSWWLHSEKPLVTAAMQLRYM